VAFVEFGFHTPPCGRVQASKPIHFYQKSTEPEDTAANDYEPQLLETTASNKTGSGWNGICSLASIHFSAGRPAQNFIVSESHRGRDAGGFAGMFSLRGGIRSS
jgi:hypothetical protein